MTRPRIAIPTTTLITPPRGSPPSATSGPGATTLHAVPIQPPSGTRVSRSPTDSALGTSRSQSDPDGLRTTIVSSTSPLTCWSTSTVSRRCGAPFVSPVPGGGVQLERQHGQRALELEALPDGSAQFLRVEGETMQEGPLDPNEPTQVRTHLQWLFAKR